MIFSIGDFQSMKFLNLENTLWAILTLESSFLCSNAEQVQCNMCSAIGFKILDSEVNWLIFIVFEPPAQVSRGRYLKKVYFPGNAEQCEGLLTTSPTEAIKRFVLRSNHFDATKTHFWPFIFRKIIFYTAMQSNCNEIYSALVYKFSLPRLKIS